MKLEPCIISAILSLNILINFILIIQNVCMKENIFPFSRSVEVRHMKYFSMSFIIVVNSVTIVLLVRARDQGAILVLVPGPSLITCSTYSFDSFLLLTFLF